MIVDYIDAYRSQFGVHPICAALTEHGISIAPSTYYKAKQRGPISDTDLGEAYAANAVLRTRRAPAEPPDNKTLGPVTGLPDRTRDAGF